MTRIDELKARMLHADNSGAGRAAKEQSAKELREFAKKFQALADKNPTTKVAEFLRDKANNINNFITLINS